MIDVRGAKIYILCPSNSVSGGPEALHQLQYYMRECGINAYLVYYFSSVTKCPPRYEIYEPRIIDYTEIEDDAKNLLIVPETATSYIRYYKRIRTCVWWLSVNNYFRVKNSSNFAKDTMKSFFNLFLGKSKKYVYTYPTPLKKADHHVCGSRYAYDYLNSLKCDLDPRMLVEPISKQFYDSGPSDDLSAKNRGDVILYNPSKPSPIMSKLLLRSDLKFKPLKGYAPTELAELYRKAKLYIDFGEFPGPERIPKESVYNGTCLIVGRRNAAINDFDIPIPEEYKINNYNDEEQIVAIIKHILSNYDECIGDFEDFRRKVGNLEKTFIEQIEEIFAV